MTFLELSLQSPQANLACDEVLLDLCDEGSLTGVLRLWESSSYFVVVGYANRVEREVDLPFCRQRGIPVLRRCSGGGTVLQGPGCLNYALALRIDSCPAFAGISSTNGFILRRQCEILSQRLGQPAQIRGQTDLAIHGLKFSGNAQRRKRSALLYHGSLLLNMDVDLVEHALRMPSRQPDYRGNRSHRDFLTNLPLDKAVLSTALSDGWGASQALDPVPLDRIETLAVTKYQSDDWNLKF